MLLAIDTSAGTSVAIVDSDAGVLAELSTDDTRRHAEVIGPFIAEALERADITPQCLSAVAVGTGPGPFTGLRVGLAAARAFAFGAGKPVVHVVSHDAIAATLTAPALVVTDARRRELYWTAYDGLDADGLPLGLQIIGRALDEERVLNTGYAIERAANFTAKPERWW